jgi:PRTRC genetic system protein A
MTQTLHDLWQRQFGCHLVWPDGTLDAPSGAVADYYLAGNGLFLRAQRPELTAIIPLATCDLTPLGRLTPGVTLHVPVFPRILLRVMLAHARQATDAQGRVTEVLWYGGWHGPFWSLCCPPQQVTPVRVQVIHDAVPAPQQGAIRDALIEVHSHGDAAPFFSATDDADERGFRLYACLGHVRQRPTITVRVGVQGRYLTIPASTVFALPEEVSDGSAF